MTATYLGLSSFFFSALCAAGSIEYKVDEAIYKVGVELSGEVAKSIWENEISALETKSFFNEGGGKYIQVNYRKNDSFNCSKSDWATQAKSDYSCGIFASNLEIEADPQQLLYSLDNFQFLDNSVRLLQNALTSAPENFKTLSSANSKIEGFILEGDFAERIFNEHLADVKPTKNLYANAKELRKEKSPFSCIKRTVAYQGERVRTEYSCWLDIKKAKVVPMGDTFTLDVDAGSLIIGKSNSSVNEDQRRTRLGK